MNSFFYKAFLFILTFFLLANHAFCEKITFSARTMSGRAGSKEDTTRLSGNANVLTETIEVRADSIELSGKDFRYVSANGKINGVHKQSHLEFSADSLKYDRETKVVTLSGNVNLIDKDNNVTAGAQIIEYDTNSQIAVLQIGVELKQKKNVCTSAYAVYRKNEQMLELNGSARVVQDKDSFSAQSITFNMDTEEIVMEGNVRGSVTDESGTASAQSQEASGQNSDGDTSEQNSDSEQTATPVDNAQSQEASEQNSDGDTSEQNSDSEQTATPVDNAQTEEPAQAKRRWRKK